MKVIWLEDVVIVQEEGQVEGEPHQRPEHRLPHQQDKVPHVIRDVVNIIQKRSHQAAFVQEARELLEVDKKTRDDVENVD